MTSQDAIELLKQLIEIPSVSRNEAAKADFIENYFTQKGWNPHRVGNNLYCYAQEYDAERPTVLLNAHIDTVKPNPSWVRQPNKANVEGDKIYGLGSNDDLASVVSLTTAFAYFKEHPQTYNLILGLSCQEEISGKEGVEMLLKHLPPIDLAVVGEPTGLQMAIAEKGLMVLDCVSHGKAGHAARCEGENAIYKAMQDIEWFRTYEFPKRSCCLGKVNMAVTMINAGTQHNVVPDTCTFTVDIRVTDCYTHQELLDEIRSHVSCDCTPRSTRLRSSGMDPHSVIVQRHLAMGKSTFGSCTMSDQALMPFPSVKVGPGDSARSHTAEEYIKPSEIEEAIPYYIQLLEGLELE